MGPHRCQNPPPGPTPLPEPPPGPTPLSDPPPPGPRYGTVGETNIKGAMQKPSCTLVLLFLSLLHMMVPYLASCCNGTGRFATATSPRQRFLKNYPGFYCDLFFLSPYTILLCALQSEWPSIIVIATTILVNIIPGQGGHPGSGGSPWVRGATPGQGGHPGSGGPSRVRSGWVGSGLDTRGP